MLSLIQEVITAFTPIKHKQTALLLGIESSGKTSLVTALASLVNQTKTTGAQYTTPGAPPTYIPPDKALRRTTKTLGQNVVELETADTVMTVWDIGGSEGIRPMWKHYIADADKIVCVIDSRESPQDIERAIDIILDVSGMLSVHRDTPTSDTGLHSTDTQTDTTEPQNIKRLLVLATKMDHYDTDTETDESSCTMNEATMASRLETIATAFTGKIDEKRDEHTDNMSHVEYNITCLPVSCLHGQSLQDVLDWLLV